MSGRALALADSIRVQVLSAALQRAHDGTPGLRERGWAGRTDGGAPRTPGPRESPKASSQGGPRAQRSLRNAGAARLAGPTLRSGTNTRDRGHVGAPKGPGHAPGHAGTLAASEAHPAAVPGGSRRVQAGSGGSGRSEQVLARPGRFRQACAPGGSWPRAGAPEAGLPVRRAQEPPAGVCSRERRGRGGGARGLCGESSAGGALGSPPRPSGRAAAKVVSRVPRRGPVLASSGLRGRGQPASWPPGWARPGPDDAFPRPARRSEPAAWSPRVRRRLRRGPQGRCCWEQRRPPRLRAGPQGHPRVTSRAPRACSGPVLEAGTTAGLPAALWGPRSRVEWGSEADVNAFLV